MIRRSFIELTFGVLLPNSHRHSSGTRRALAPVSPPPPGPVLPAPPVEPDAPWFAEWLHRPRRPVLAADLPQIRDLRQRRLATEILQRMRSGAAIEFRYYGGTEPGETREVLPVLLFVPEKHSHDSAARPKPALEPRIYLLAWCQTRSAPRSFRLDRMACGTGRIDSSPVRGRAGQDRLA